jgi:Ser/Thr protein kinase RdoA (MazF antagonist)
MSSRTPGDACTEAVSTLRLLAAAAPGWKERLLRIAKRIEALRPQLRDELRFVHGDLHPGQVLLQEGKVAFVDFDRAHRGDAVSDVGSVLASLLDWGGGDSGGTAAEIFCRAYESARRRHLEGTRLRFWTSVALLRVAMRPFRQLDPDWRALCDRALRQSEELIA